MITAVGGRVPVVPGTGSAKLDETIALTGAAYHAGADAVLVITPYYARPTQAPLVPPSEAGLAKIRRC